MPTVLWVMHEGILVDFTPGGATIDAGYHQGTLTGLS
jgi:hypothetical protein